jgi:hypothetical protein
MAHGIIKNTALVFRVNDFGDSRKPSTDDDELP